MAAEFDINGDKYPIPLLASFDLDEEQILYDQTGLTTPDFMAADPDSDDEAQREHNERILSSYKRPEFRLALAMIAYRRKHPETPLDELRIMAGKVHAAAAWIGVLTGAGDADPPAGTLEPDASLPNGEHGSSESSGSGSTDGSGRSDGIPATTGATR